MTSRERFESWITAPPYEKHTHQEGRESAWPDQYREYATQLAWEAWQAAEAQGQAERDALKALLREFAAEVEGPDNGDGTMSDCSDALWDKIKAALAAKEGE